MYPKPTSSQDKSASRGKGSREQLHDLLMTKFRGKYHVSVQNERELDVAIQAEVKKALSVVNSLTEKDLNALDSRVNEICRLKRDNADAKSVRSQAAASVKSSASRAKSNADLKRLDIDQSMAPYSRPQEMTEEEWFALMQKDHAKFENE
jgi:hypothetical protein